MTKLTNVAVNTLIAKLFTKLARLDLSSGIAIRYCSDTLALMVTVQGVERLLAHTNIPDSWMLDGRRNWRAIKALVLVVEAAQVAPESIAAPAPTKCTQVEPEAPEVPFVRPDGVMSSREAKALLADAPKTKTANPTLGSLFAGTKKGNAQRKPNIPRKR